MTSGLCRLAKEKKNTVKIDYGENEHRKDQWLRQQMMIGNEQ
jgi:hypothetical protein